ncbi:high mobility group protein [Plasmodium ovale wallikeri]|uniref:High mobility group protein n=3 Tax=Plasmodium ovale TaxID=36330 RepID=A0A1A8WWE1_PLAOA|nr:high mobility group protein [Plasmodium ovale curtisi]SBT44042.1 high mobility group protein [Plasmodium ovale wallikeri]SBT78613.1 high mobility group protein B1, putative [Plasmodium ovale]SBS97296.1 high mobility group protein [Plasmodium ovale curtisi]SBT44550.1 high mobility group protein [Plasmodium ovale wallikeri]
MEDVKKFKDIKNSGAKEVKKRRKNKKDPLAPKRSLSAYMFFAKEKRAEIISRDPELNKDVATVGKMIGEAWNKLEEGDRIPYEKKAQEDKVRYEKEKVEYAKSKVKA